MKDLLNHHPSAWPEIFAQMGVAKFHGRNAARWVFQRGAHSWTEMTDLPANLREQLQAEAPLGCAKLLTSSGAKDGAEKVLLELEDSATVEAVGMPGTAGRTVCLSTQVGCPVRCAFCASGLEGLGRNLSQGEILEQALWLRRAQGPFQRVVIMGMGEAGFNLDAVLGALDVLMDPEGFGMSARRITLSTVGPKGALPRIAEWGRPVTLALSLHAPDDALRHELVPGVAKRTIEETLTEVDELFAANGREYTVEYVLLAGVNDSPDQATALADLLFQRRCHVNLIPYNPVEETEFDRPSDYSMESFAKRLQDRGLSVTLRRSLGRQADAACGQLRRRQRPPSRPATEV
ncbi:MAG: 23S rRNA (adenine(2503)-C(2))-methyltransferase RlmN [Planctomycetes bacterium]|nr:23S rRNA (adenine(2503)-C(2))-methyltransferase RlmN [Planctomycetota bacterium]MCP4772258.1 23S rRNA (adenine(2503)-C(2))-methyltransferase RlmN [Planctomycetota bacterium]MCP4861314.1 23S rRNA (adenine(2503)-C(2))-methyltransferase RlmN [Planctomycetota bacterium]